MLLSGLFPTTTWIIDIVNVSFLVITPIILWSWLRARHGAYTLHRNVQISLFLVLLVVVFLFEMDLRSLGGIFKASVYGVLVALSGCLRGMQCGNSSSAVGDAATSAVVTGIVFIVSACGAFSVIFYVLGI